MSLTVDQVKSVAIPRNITRLNNIKQVPAAIYNNSVNLYEAIEVVVDDLGAATASSTNLGVSQASTDVTITSSTGTDTTILAASSLVAGVMTTSDKINLDALVTLSGVAGGNTDLGTFTGTIISDNTTVKNALQEIETTVDALVLSGGADGNGIYTGSDTIPNATVATMAGTFQIDNNSNTLTLGNPSGRGVLIASGYVDLGDVTASANGRITLNSSGVNMYGTTTNEFVLDNAGGGSLDIAAAFTITDSTGVGLAYFADYSGTLTSLSLAHKGYVDAADAVIADDVANLVTLTGVAVDSVNLGTFAGSTISDNVTIKAALQELELELEAVIGGGPGTTNLGTIYTGTTFTVTSDTGTNALVNAATGALAGAMTAADKTNLDALVTLSGVAAASTDLGTFTGVTITDNVTIKTALQELETAVDAFSAASGLPAGTDTQTIRYNGVTQEASSVITNNGTNVGINTAPDANFDLLVAGPIHANAGILVSTGTGDPSGTIAASGVRLINPTGGTGQTYNIGSLDTGELGIYYGGGLTWRMFNDGHVSLNDASNHGMYTISSDIGAASTYDTLTLLYFAGNDAAYIRFRDQADTVVGAIHAEGGNLEIEVPTIFTITAGTEGFNFNGVGNLVFPNQAADPGSPAEGSIWYNNTDDRFKGQDNAGVETFAFLSDLPVSPTGTYSVQDSVASYTVGTDNTVYLRANSASMDVTLSDSMREGEMYYLYIKGFDPYTVTLRLEAAMGNEWWIVGDNNETVSDAITLTFDYTDRNVYVVVQRRGSRFYTRYIAF